MQGGRYGLRVRLRVGYHSADLLKIMCDTSLSDNFYPGNTTTVQQSSLRPGQLGPIICYTFNKFVTSSFLFRVYQKYYTKRHSKSPKESRRWKMCNPRWPQKYFCNICGLLTFQPIVTKIRFLYPNIGLHI